MVRLGRVFCMVKVIEMEQNIEDDGNVVLFLNYIEETADTNYIEGGSNRTKIKT